MIHTTMKEAARYAAVSPRIAEALAAIKALAAEPFTAGRHEVKGEEIYINAAEYDTAPAETKTFEAHRQYIDVMYILEGEENIGYKPLEKLGTITKEYTADGDYLLAALEPGYMSIRMEKGDLCFLFPEDAHAPGMETEKTSHVRKFIAKVLL